MNLHEFFEAIVLGWVLVTLGKKSCECHCNMSRLCGFFRGWCKKKVLALLWSSLSLPSLPFISGVVPFNTWLISSWEANKCCYKLSKCTKWHLFYSKWLKLSFWVKIVVILSVAQLVTTVIFFPAWDKSRVKWDNSQNSTQKMRT